MFMNNYLLSLKIKELDLLKKDYVIVDNILVLKNETCPELLGCDVCYGKKPFATSNGWNIDIGTLVRFSEKYSNYSNEHPEVANNIWMCPKCDRIFKELTPNFAFTEMTNVSI